MATLTAAEGRCLNCKTAMKPDRDDCPKCGDPVRPKIKKEVKPVGELERLKLELAETMTEHTMSSKTRARGLRKEIERAEVIPTPPSTTLSDEQKRALFAIHTWFIGDRRDLPFFLAGAAGTGKTTLAKHLAQALGVAPVFGAYTGKAAHVLRRKGVPASTIHSAIYRPVDNREVKAEIERLTRKWHDQGGTDEQIRARLDQLEGQEGKPFFELNPASPWADADLIVLDEVSMVNAAMARDIESFGVPVLVLGDIEQLPPIEGSGYYTRSEPDFTLEQVHRQALESPVYALATDIRKGVPWPVEKVSLEKAMAADQIIVWKNATRWNLTEKIREKMGRPAGVPVQGDKVMCLVNNKTDLGIFNGQQFTVLRCRPDTADTWALELGDDDGHVRHLLAFKEGFQGLAGEKEMRDKRRAWRGGVGAFTFAQVITCHKSQGSEWDSVYVVDQTAQMWKSTAEEKRRWMYTATSRASELVTIAAVRP